MEPSAKSMAQSQPEKQAHSDQGTLGEPKCTISSSESQHLPDLWGDKLHSPSVCSPARLLSQKRRALLSWDALKKYFRSAGPFVVEAKKQGRPGQGRESERMCPSMLAKRIWKVLPPSWNQVGWPKYWLQHLEDSVADPYAMVLSSPAAEIAP